MSHAWDEIPPPPRPVPTRRMSREEFFRWAEAQPEGKYERVDGRVVSMAPERAAHAQVKASAWLALREAVRAAGLRCQAFTDGLGVRVGDGTNYEPDVLVNCGDPVPPDSLLAPHPVILVEVSSPSTAARDASEKLTDYFRVPSVAHYLLVSTRRRSVVHHARGEGDRIETRIVTSGPLTLDPPGLTVTVEDFYADLPPPDEAA